MSVLPIECCGNCLHWSADMPMLATGIARAAGADPDIGSCQVYSPTLTREAGMLMSCFPQVHRRRWCGEWTAPIIDGPDGGGEEDVPVPDDVVVPFRSVA